MIAPAVLLAAALGVLEFLQGDPIDAGGHLRWSDAKADPLLRRTYVRFYAMAPVVFVVPALCIAVGFDDAIGKHRRTVIIVVAVAVAVTAMAIWGYSARKSRPSKCPERAQARGALAEHRRVGGQQAPGSQGKLRTDEILLEAGTGALAAIAAIVLCLAVGTWHYAWIVPLWAIGFFVALMLVWLRGAVGDAYMSKGPGWRAAGWIVASWVATALWLLPAFVAMAAAWPLQNATVCTKPTDATRYDTAGRFIGETKDRVYIGDEGHHWIIAVPSAKVTRLFIGSEAVDTAQCDRSSDGRA